MHTFLISNQQITISLTYSFPSISDLNNQIKRNDISEESRKYAGR